MVKANIGFIIAAYQAVKEIATDGSRMPNQWTPDDRLKVALASEAVGKFRDATYEYTDGGYEYEPDQWRRSYEQFNAAACLLSDAARGQFGFLTVHQSVCELMAGFANYMAVRTGSRAQEIIDINVVIEQIEAGKLEASDVASR